MANRTADLKVVAKIDLAALRASFKEAVKLAREEGAAIADAIGGSFSFNPAKAKASLREQMRQLAEEARKAQGDTVVPPTRPTTGGGGRGGGGAAPPPKTAPDPGDDEAKRAAAHKQAMAQILAAELRNAQAIEALDAKTTDELIEHIDELQQKKKALKAAERRETDAAAKAIIKQERAAAEEELGLSLSLARKRKEVKDEGAGAGIGILGLGRKLIKGDLEGLTADFKKMTGGGALAFNQVAQQVTQVSSAINDLAQPTVALDTVTQQIKTLGKEAADMAPNLRAAALEMAQSGDFEFQADDLGTAMFDALASGVKGGEEGLKGFASTAAKLATGGGAQLSEAVALMAGQLNAYGKSSDNAQQFADIFFNTVNYGVTSVAELSATLSNVVPTAAGLGIELENVGASLAFMTSRGIPTAASTTKLNALMLELAKPAANLAPILKKAGVSLESLKQDDLPTTLKKVSAALAESGKAAVQVFSSSEAGAAFQTLTSDLAGFEQTFKDVRDTAGSTDNAYTQMSDSISVRTKAMLASVNGFITSGLDKMGSGLLSVVSASTQVAPMVTSLAGLKSILPQGAVEGIFNFAKGLVGAMVPALATTATAETAAGTAGAAMWTAILGPLLPIIAGVAAVVAGFVILYNAVNEVEAAVKGAFAAIGAVIGGAGDIIGAFVDGGLLGGFAKLGETAADAFATEYKAVLSAADLEDALENLADAQAEALEGKGKQDAAKGLDELVAKYNKATTDVEKNAIAEKIGEGFPGAVQKAEVFNEKTGQIETRMTLIADKASEISENLKADGAESIADAQEDAVLGLQAQLQVLDQQKAKVDELNAKLAGQKAQGIDTSATQKELDDAKAAAEKAQANIAGTLSTGKQTGMFDNLPVELQGVMDGMKDGLKPVVQKMEQDAANARIGESLGKAAAIDGNLDANDALGALVKKFQSTTDEVEKRNIAKAIATQVPGAVTQYDELGNAIDVNADKVLSFVDANSKAFGKDQEAARTAFTNDLKIQADQLGDTRAQITTLTDKIAEYDRTGKDASGLRTELAATKLKADEQAVALGNNIQQGKKFGLIKGDVAGVGKELGLSTRQAQNAAIGVDRIKQQTVAAQGEAADLAAEFSNMRAQVDKAVSDDLAAVALVRVKKALNEEITADEEKAAQEAAARLKVAISRQKTFNKTFENLQIEYGLKEREKKARHNKDMSGLDRQLEVERLKSQQRLAEIDNEFLRSITAAQDAIVLKKKEHAVELKKLDQQIIEEQDTRRKEELRRQRDDIRNRINPLEIKGLEDALKNTIEKGRVTVGADILTIGDEIAKAGTSVQLKLNEALTPTDGALDAATTRKLGEERVALIREQGEQAVAEAVRQSEFFKKVAADGATAQIDALSKATLGQSEAQQAVNDRLREIEEENEKRRKARRTDLITVDTDAELSRLRGQLMVAERIVVDANADLSASFAETRSDLIAQFSGLTVQQINTSGFTDEQRKLAFAVLAARLDADRAASEAELAARKRNREAELNDRLKGVRSVAEQEREIALNELENELDERRTRWAGNEAQLAEIARDGARKRAEIEREFHRQTSVLFRLSLIVKEGIIEAFERKREERDRADLDREREKLNQEEQLLRDSLDQRLISYADWSQKQADLAQRRSDVEKGVSSDAFNFDEEIKQAGIIVTQRANEEIQADHLKRSEAYHTAWDAAYDLTGKTEEEAKKLTEARGDALEKGYWSLASSAVASFGMMIASGKDAGDAFLSIMIDTAIQFLDMMIPVWIAGAYGTTVAEMGPLGLAIASGLIAVVHGLASIAKSGLHLKDGDVRIKGPGTRTSDSIPIWGSVDESMINADATLAGGPRGYTNEDALRWVNRKRRPLAEFFAPMFKKMDLGGMGRRALELPPLSLSAITVGEKGLSPEFAAMIAEEQAATRAELAALREQNERLIAWTKRTAKSNAAMDERDRKRKPTAPTPGSRGGTY